MKGLERYYLREDQPWIELSTAAVRVGSGGKRGEVSGPAADVAITAAASIITGVACYVRALYCHFLRTLYQRDKAEVIVVFMRWSRLLGREQ